MADDYPVDGELVSEQLSKTIMMKVAAAKELKESDESRITFLELDSHTDSPVVGRMAQIIEKAGRTVSVSGFTDRIGKPIRVEVVTAALMYECDKTGKAYLLMMRNALHVPDMTTCLIHPIMMRLSGLEVDECPKFLSKKPNERDHSILC